MLGHFGRSYLFVLAALLPIVNPAAAAPIFLSMTPGAAVPTRALLARRIARNTAWLLFGAMFVGSYVLEFFGISLPIVRVGGGLIVAASAWRMLTATASTDVKVDDSSELAEAFTPDMARRQAFYPLTFPLTCGPGSISVAITVGASLADQYWMVSMARVSGGTLALLSVAALVYVAFRYASQLLKPLGEAGAVIFLRLSAFILLCIGAQIFWDGAHELGVNLLREGMRSLP